MRDQWKLSWMIVTLLFAILAAALGWYLAGRRGPEMAITTSGDRRTALSLPDEARQAVLQEMRQMLGAIGGAMTAATSGDTTALVAALAPAGSAAAADPTIEALLPPAWKKLAEATHGGFDSLATALRHTRSTRERNDTLLAGLARVSNSCMACHETFRIELGQSETISHR